MNIFYPQFRLSLLPSMLGYALLGALVAGIYGIVHDQFTYSISPEYFTRLKFFSFITPIWDCLLDSSSRKLAFLQRGG
jgi:hypothetical protein